MSIRGKAYVMGAFEHPLREAPNTSTPQLHAECARGALADAGLSFDDVDGYFCAGDAPGFGGLSMIDYMGLKNVRHLDSTETGGSSYIVHVGHAAEAIAAGKCSVALITLAGRPRRLAAAGRARRTPAALAELSDDPPEAGFENIYGGSTHNTYGMCAMRPACTSTARPRSSWPGSSGSPPATTPNGTSTPSCGMWSPSSRWSVHG